MIICSPMTIIISNLELWTHLGVTEEEQTNEQRISVTLELECEECNACKTDDIADTVDYEEVVKQIKRVSETNHKTLEKLGIEICDMILKNKKAKKASAELTKFILPETKSVSVSITKP